MHVCVRQLVHEPYGCLRGRPSPKRKGSSGCLGLTYFGLLKSPASSFQQQKLRVCEVCSAYLGLHDNDRRLADHFGGKLHLGFIEIREKLEELKVHW